MKTIEDERKAGYWWHEVGFVSDYVYQDRGEEGLKESLILIAEAVTKGMTRNELQEFESNSCILYDPSRKGVSVGQWKALDG